MAIDPGSVQEILLKRRKLALLQAKKALLVADPLRAYVPHPKQDMFHRAGRFKKRMVRAGNRFGKSIMGCAEDCAWLRHERVWYPKDDIARTIGIPQRPIRGLVIANDWDKVDEIFTSQRGTEGKLWKFLPRGYVKTTKRNHTGAIDLVECVDGSILRFDTVRSWMSNPQGSESSAWDFIHVDEPCPEGMWKGHSRGLMDTDGSCWFTLTPLREAWINDLFFPDGRNQEEAHVEENGRPLVWSVSGSTFDNLTLPKQAVEDFKNSLTLDEQQCRIYGVPLHLSGLVYKEFNFGVHVLQDLPKGWADWNQPPKNYNIRYSIDPHPQTPHAVLFEAVSPHGQVFFYDEIFVHTTIADLAEQIKNKVGDSFVTHAKIDPLAYINDPITDSNMAEELANNGVYVEKATKALAQGILHTKECLKRENYLYVVPTLKRFLWEINRWSWDERENKPVDKDDHMMENLYRLLLDDPEWIDPDEPTPVIGEEVIDRAVLTIEDLDWKDE